MRFGRFHFYKINIKFTAGKIRVEKDLKRLNKANERNFICLKIRLY